MYLNNGFEIERIYLISEFQGKGLGEKLLTKILNMGKEMGYIGKHGWACGRIILEL